MLKKKYVRPKLEVELFQLNQSVASCGTRVLFGPNDSTEQCGDWGFVDPFDLLEREKRVAQGPVYPFYDYTSCECYYNAPRQSGFFSS